MLHLSETSRPAWSDGSPLPFGTLTFYAENTHELLDVYDADSLGSTLANPVEADSDGIFPDIWLDATLRYGVALHDRYGRLVYHVPAYRTPVTEGAFKYLDAQIRSVDGDGRPIPGDTLTLTEDEEVVSGYADRECTVPLTNPIVADAGGLFPAIYLPDPEGPPPEELTVTVGDSWEGEGGVPNAVIGYYDSLNTPAGAVSDGNVSNEGYFPGLAIKGIYDVYTVEGNTINGFKVVVADFINATPPAADLFASIEVNGEIFLVSEATTSTFGDYREWFWEDDHAGFVADETYPVEFE